MNTVPGAQTVKEDTPLFIAGVSVDDVDSPTLTVTLSVLNGSVAVVPGLALIAGNLTATATITGTLAEVNLALANVKKGQSEFLRFRHLVRRRLRTAR